MRLLLALLFLIAAAPALGAEDTAALPVPPWQSPLLQNHPLVGRIWLPAANLFVEPPELVQLLDAADFVLLGEKHDNTDHHKLQAWALQQIIAAGRRPLVAFEMVSPEQEPGLRRHLAEHPGQIEGLDTDLDWANNHWPEWSNYRPIFAAALATGLEIRPANAPLADVKSLSRRQPILPAKVKFYRLDKKLDSATDAALATEIRDAHCGQLPEQVVPGMVDVQRARDASMARAMTTDAPKGAVLIAGSGHVRSDRGVPVQIAALAPKGEIFSLAFVEVAEGKDDPAAYGSNWGVARPPFDAVWFTPRDNDDDPCAGLAEFLKKKKEQEKQ